MEQCLTILERTRNQIRTVTAVRGWAREPYRAADPAAEARRLLLARESSFLTLARDAIYGYLRSPYRRLLRHAGCEYADLEAEVAARGLEETLRRLAAEGVYVTHDEMKGREPVRRGTAVFYFAASDFDNPLVTPHFIQSTSGSTGSATSVGISLDHFRQQLLHTALSAGFHGVADASVALWIPTSEWSVSRAMRLAKIVGRVEHWFTQVPLGFRRDVSTLGLMILLRPHRLHLPVRTHIPMTEPGPVVHWMADELRQGRRVLLVTFPASAARACALAVREGLSLEGAVVLAAGESVTAAKRAAIEAAGASCLPLFGCTETGESAEGCLAPVAPDDMHVYEHKFALVSRRREIGPDRCAETPLFTTLGSQTPKIFLNGDTGDVGVVEQRDCGCPWGQLGYRTHLRDVWSYSKLTAEGMTLPGELVFEVLEKVLPERFGGRAGDYQLVAEPGDDGVTQYLLALNPSLGPVDEDAVARAFRQALGRGSFRLSADFLHRAGQLRVVRRPPVVQASGKSLPVVLTRRGASTASRRSGAAS